NLLGYSVARILDANGNRVVKANLVNDRGIHICKSMLAWQKWGKGETPDSSGMKGDHLVGKYYVEFDKHYKKEIAECKAKGMGEEEAEKKAPLILEAQDMLRRWEAGDPEVVALWTTMNNWVYKGFDQTYARLGVAFDKMYYESKTYLIGKEIVLDGLNRNHFFKKADGSVWADLQEFKLEEKVLLRADGTSVYITQDIGTATERFKEFPDDSHFIYTVGNEQDHHFKVLFAILKKLGYRQADNCYHLSYGMVELPEGKMKSREGTVVDADDLIDEMVSTAKEASQQLGKLEEFTPEEAEKLYHVIAMGALKYFILKVDPKKKMLFNPKESIDLNGNTGPFIQYTYARIQSILRKVGPAGMPGTDTVNWKLEGSSVEEKEKSVLKWIYDFPAVVKEAGANYSPAVIANYVYELARHYNQFYHDVQILKEGDEQKRNFRLALSHRTAEVIKNAMALLGIEVPERM
ncbi:MAG TPA: arginine--tRNA ligase, partial [Bacteroidia bacterium]